MNLSLAPTKRIFELAIVSVLLLHMYINRDHSQVLWRKKIELASLAAIFSHKLSSIDDAALA